MNTRRKIHLALPRHDAIRAAVDEALDTACRLEICHFVVTNDIDGAEVVVTDSATGSNELSDLPESVRFMQLIDCGSGAPNSVRENLVVANASSMLVDSAVEPAINQWNSLRLPQIEPSDETPKVAGIVGFGMLGFKIGERLNTLGATIWVNDIRTPRQQSFQQVGARRSSLDMLLSLSDIIFVAIHHGPTSDPLLSHRELRLLTTGAAVVNLSGPKVVDTDAIATLNAANGREIDYREIVSDAGASSAAERAEDVTRWVLDNLGAWALGRQPRSIVETVTHSYAGDPAFWSSRMAPRQTPV